MHDTKIDLRPKNKEFFFFIIPHLPTLHPCQTGLNRICGKRDRFPVPFYGIYRCLWPEFYYRLVHKKYVSSKLKNIINEKFKKKNFLPAFYPILLLMISPKNFEKNSHFENMTAGFLLSCQNSLRQTTPEIKHFQR